jgi:hypothetical protein
MDPDPTKKPRLSRNSYVFLTSVADTECLSRITHHDIYPSRFPYPGSLISDPTTATKRRGKEKFLSYLFDLTSNFTELRIILFLNRHGKNFSDSLRIIVLFAQKIVSSLSKNMGLGSGNRTSEIRDPEKTYSGSQGHKGTGSRIRNSNTVSA